MKYFFLLIDYSIPILMILSYPWWKKIANGNINPYSGMRTSLSMKSKENWKKANLLCGTYFLRAGIGLLIFTSFLRYVKIVPMEWNSLIIAFVGIISMIAVTVLVNQKIKEC
ncbi:MAG TPA: SdpI family protein [Candidatus Ruthenibacterium merdavium]|uniref:SdpI family protein n=1 Tax=Candidatus Ruthenibacterium merdavium TaxID=2838752 RepID=A0A9D2Q5E6_9FIRM|nr:SdpI family protein [Candidatus Ruthenibacterium merdavium]